MNNQTPASGSPRPRFSRAGETGDAGFAALEPVTGRLGLRAYLRELAARRDFIFTVPRQELQAQHLNTVLGNLWFLVNPLLQTAVYYLIFGLLLETDRGLDNFIVYLVVGVLTLGYFNQTLTKASHLMEANETLIRSIYFPRAVIPAASALTNLYNYLPAFAVMLFVALITGERPSWRWLLLPLILGALFLFVSGAGFLFARLGNAFRDLSQIVPHGTRLLFYASGTIFDPRAFSTDPAVLIWFELNPIYQFLTLIRWCLIDVATPWWFWVTAPAWAVFSLAIGFLVFWRGELSYGSTRR
ncbi:MAG: ABC transporter permease [Acidimicrobiales bacterium]